MLSISGRGFTGHRHNNTGANDLGLIYMRARFYVPSIGRFASADTIVPEPTDPQSFNRYSYGYNNPVKFTDPDGHIACDSNYLPGIDQGACLHDTDEYDTYYPTVSRTANAIIGAGFGKQLPKEYAHYDNSAAWDSYFRNATGLISEPLDWILTGEEIVSGEVSAPQAGGMMLLAALPVTQGGWGDELIDGGSDIVYRALRADERSKFDEKAMEH